MAQFIATANARPFVQAARGGPSYILTADGLPAAVERDIDNIQVIHATVKPGSGKTIYSILGEWSVLVSVVMLGGVLIWRTRSLKK